ncbi:hypothetical protein ACFOLJ_09020 [Rugamonas sp. CCM 8940]|uniref:hypothetical protein n=1 Tax=Rugamonas sp. CCM 8940 TaxID=2765359 RepID=UPI0018F65118|nr:hypothetical protein [Rugamonas sp. CCM 8940]MBJ7309392.1 hypothetical protein [Rugamonas sp. CCM 8940]
MRGTDGKFVNTLEHDLPNPGNLGRAELRLMGSGHWKIFDSGEPRTPKGSFNYIVQNGTVYVGTGNAAQVHVDIARGNPVEYAGRIIFRAGKATKGMLNFWNNASGHYIPEPLQPEWAESIKLPVDKFKAYEYD